LTQKIIRKLRVSVNGSVCGHDFQVQRAAIHQPRPAGWEKYLIRIRGLKGRDTGFYTFAASSPIHLGRP
jgi:hypothetical protein